jgi:hypothetical protein
VTGLAAQVYPPNCRNQSAVGSLSIAGCTERRTSNENRTRCAGVGRDLVCAGASDVIVLPELESSSVSHNRTGWAKLIEQLRGFSISAIGLEGERRLRARRDAGLTAK